MKYRAVIFDFNGTLYWDTALHNRAWDKFLENHNIRLSDEEKLLKLHGKPNRDILKGIFDGKLSPDKIRQMTIEKELIYHEIALAAGIDYAPGAVDFMRYLKEKNIPYTIATSSDWINIQFYIRYMSLSKWVKAENIVYENGSFRGKPEGDIFILAMEKLNALPEEVLIFEDSPMGIMAAENAGAGGIVIVNSSNHDYSHLPYPVIRSFDEVDRNWFME